MINFDSFFKRQTFLFRKTPVRFYRSLYNTINWDFGLVEIKGARGTGKTTMMLQKAKQLANNKNLTVLYISADDPVFFIKSLIDVAEDFYKIGGTYLFIDEIHRYPNKIKDFDWSAELKFINDSFPDLKIIYSGSSILEIYKGFGDLSRRRLAYKLQGLSFRENLKFLNLTEFKNLSLEDILENHMHLAQNISEKTKVFKYFYKYLKSGYFPFFKKTKSEQEYFFLLREIINIIIESDLPKIINIEFLTLNKLKKLFGAIATSPPYTAEIKKLADFLNVKDYKSLLNLIDLLDKAELLKQLKQKAKGNKILQKPDKIYLNNTNLMYALDFGQINTGTIRETFFLNQISYKHKVNYPKTSDFLVDDKYFFEIGGKTKTRKQISAEDNAFVVADDIEIGFGNIIPLWLFGFLY